VATARRDAIRSLGAIGVGLLAALGLDGGSAARRRGKRGKTKTGPEGPTGPAGPEGPTFASVVIQGDTSPPLTGEDLQESGASCGGVGKLLGCGYSITETVTQAPHLLVRGIFPASDGCSVVLVGTNAAAAASTWSGRRA
jgi:hypothetical protein